MSGTIESKANSLIPCKAAYMEQSFKSKAGKYLIDIYKSIIHIDFASYFRNQLQLYVPPLDFLTKEWIRLVLRGEKRFCPLADLNPSMKNLE